MWLNVPTFSLCLPEFVEKSHHDCFGSRNMSAYNNPELVIVYDQSVGGATYQIDVFAHIHNYLCIANADIQQYLR